MKKDAASAQAGKGSSVDYAAENARLRAENLELRRVNELLKEASAFFASELAPRCLEMIAFIDQYRDRFGARVHLSCSGQTPPGWFHECSWLPRCEKPSQLRLVRA